VDGCLRKVGVLLGDGEDDLIVFFLAELVQIGQQCGLDGFDRHQSGNYWDLMDRVYSTGKIVSVQLLLEQFEGIKILHKIQFNIN
jgi:hypothetical protein